mgnify:FL=1
MKIKLSDYGVSVDDLLEWSGLDVNRVEQSKQYYARRLRQYKIITTVEVIICVFLLCLKFGIL